ncbi:MAG: hypothetical protein ACRED8_12470, partial [Caulobacteraceae bacterium]
LGTYAMVAAGALRGRLTGASAHAPWRAPAGKAVFLLALAGVLAIAWAEWEDRATGRPSLLANLAIMAAFALYWALFARRKGAWALTGPEGALLVASSAEPRP